MINDFSKGNSLITEKEVRIVIDKAEQSLAECYDILGFFKSPNEGSPVSLIFDFQPKLAECLYALMQFYQKLHQEEKWLICNKKAFVEEVFKAKMKTNAFYQQAIREIIKIGKSLGDAFAWFFYMNNREELEKHTKHESTGLFSSGIGGLGEIEFIKNNQLINGLFVIYHGITNMLRIGDFSLYAFNKGIVANGELKTKKENNTLIIDANIVSKLPLNNLNSVSASHKSMEQEFPRLKKQILQQTDLVKTQKNPNRLCGYADYEHQILNGLNKDDAVVFNEDCSLALIGVHLKGDSLSERILSQHDIQDNFSAIAKSIFDKLIEPSSSYNCLVTSFLDAESANAKIPVFWWDIDDNICKALYFNMITVVTAFNPARLLLLFEKNGYTICNGNIPAKTHLIKVYDHSKIELSNMEMIYNLISKNLMKTNDAFEFIKSFLELGEKGKIPLDSKVEMHITLHN